MATATPLKRDATNKALAQFGSTDTIPLGNLPAHASTHESGGSDAIPLDTLGAPTDVTTLNASTSTHGLLKKLANDATQFMNGVGNWTTPPGGSLVYTDGSIPGGNTLTSTSETAFASTYTITASSLVAGSVVKVRLWGTYGGTVLPSITAKIKWGSTVMLSTGAITGLVTGSGLGWWAEADFIVVSVGASGSVECDGYVEFSTAATTGLSVNPAPAAKTIDTTVSQAITATVQWGAGGTAQTITLRGMSVYIFPTAIVSLSGGTNNTVAKWTGAASLANSTITDDGTTVTPTKRLAVSTVVPAQLSTGNNNNWNPGDVVFAEISGDGTGASIITGIANGTDGRLLVITNDGTDNITFAHQNTSSTAANRLTLTGSASVILGQYDTVFCLYEGGGSRWKLAIIRGVPHNHQSNAQGGTLDAAAIATGVLALARIPSIPAASITAEAWTTYTPTITAQTGTPTTTSATGRYIQYGKLVFCQMDVTITTVGTAAGSVKATLPVTAASNVYAGSTYEYQTSGKSGAAVILGSAGSQSDTTHVWFRDAAGTTLFVNGYKIAVTIVYEAA